MDDKLEFDVLGFNVRFKAEDNGKDFSVSEVVDYVRLQADEIKAKSPNLNEGQVAILLALKLGSEKMSLEKEYRENIDKLRLTAVDALQCIEEVSPTIT